VADGDAAALTSDRALRVVLERDYAHVRKMPSGEWAGISAYLFTVGLHIGLHRDGYRVRYCFESQAQAVESLSLWDGVGDPPGRWIKAKGIGVDRANPRFKGVEIVQLPS
jgi:hypothetical protein